MLGHHRSDGSKLVGKFKYTAWNSKFYDKNAIVKGPVLKDYLPATLKSQGHKSKICTQQNHLIIIFIIIGTRIILIFPTFQIRFLFRKQLVNGNARTFKFESSNFFVNFIRNPIYIFV